MCHTKKTAIATADVGTWQQNKVNVKLILIIYELGKENCLLFSEHAERTRGLVHSYLYTMLLLFHLSTIYSN